MNFPALLFLMQAAQELPFPLGIGPDDAGRLAEEINRARGLAEALQASRAAVRHVLADSCASRARNRPEQAELVVLF